MGWMHLSDLVRGRARLGEFRLGGRRLVPTDRRAVGGDARLSDVLGHVLQVRAHHVDDVHRGESARQVV